MNYEIAHKSPKLFYLFAFLSLINLAAVGFDLEWLNFLTKPFLVSSLAAWYYQSTKGNWSGINSIFLLGLSFSVLGDSLLMFVKTKGEIFFLLGLGSFLIAHLCYIVAFTIFPSLKLGALSTNKSLAVPFFAALIGVLSFLWPDLGSFRLPVLLYAVIIIAMSAFCFNMKNRVLNSVFLSLFVGAVLFVVSDMTIAVVKFKLENVSPALGGLSIMITYLLGQFSLTNGMILANQTTEPVPTK